MALTYELIGSVTATGSSTTMTISSIPQTYTDLVIRVAIRSALSSLRDTVNITFQSVSGTRTQVSLLGQQNNISYNSVTTGSNWAYDFPATANTATANTFGFFELYLPSYATTNNKQSYATYGSTGDGTNNTYGGMTASYINFTSAITAINVACGSNLTANSNFALYGIKRA
jgi:hypothetical protein